MQKSKPHVPKLLRALNGQSVGARHAISTQARFLCSTLFAVLAVSTLAPRASAQNYTAATDAQLRQAIIDANSDGFPTSTITLTGDIALASIDSMMTATKTIIIDTGPFKLSGMAAVGNGSGGTLQFGGNVTLRGTMRGGDASATPLSAHPGTGGVAVTQTDGTLHNEATVTGGTGGTGGRFASVAAGGIGGAGMTLTGTTLINQGSVTGGAGGNFTNGTVGGGGSNVAGGGGGTGLVLGGGSLDNHGSITGGLGGSMLTAMSGDNQFGGNGGVGAIVTGGSHSNSGSITGGAGGSGTNVPGEGAGSGGGGLVLDNGSIINSGSGSIVGGSGGLESVPVRGGYGGIGVTLHASSIQNDGVITGGLGAGTTGGGGDGLNANAGSSVTNTNRISGGDGAIAGNAISGAGFTIVNTGTIAGGNRTTLSSAGGIAISGSGLGIVNSGTITPGTNNVGAIVANSTAIQFTAGANSLELRNGSAINGLVLGGGTADTLTLGGSANSTLDVSQIGAAAQYRNFEGYQKTGTSLWTLTGTTSTATPWILRAGTLSVSSDATLGPAASSPLTFDGGTLQVTGTTFTSTTRAINWGADGGGIDVRDPCSTFTVSQTLASGGALTKSGDGRLVLTANNSYTGGTTVSAGTLILGGAGPAGTITGDVTNDGSLVFDRSDSASYTGTISGSGDVAQIGSGTTVLAGANSYAGTTVAALGALIVNGDQSAATGDVIAFSGAALGGNGTIGGNVTINDGATLQPGDVGSAPGTLTILKKLSLGSASFLDYNFGQANVVGGAFNDLTKVGGDLVLGGTLNISTAPGGSFDAGIYRVISYGGALTNNGLAIAGVGIPTLFVQTSIDHQVNLVNTAGLTLNFWDGTLGPKFNSRVDGGSGNWQNSTGNDNWTEPTGAINAQYSDGAFAIFGGAPGIVTVDNSLGNVTASGMQFATDGYRIEGDSLTLVGPQSIIRVGDGTTDGARYTATIASELTGTSELIKRDSGKLVLAGTNTYSGGTTINGGTLQIGDGGVTGSIVGNVSNDGTLGFDRSDAVSFNGSVSGTGAVNQLGTGTTTLTANNSYTGETTISAGSLIVDGDQSAAAGKTSVNNGATLGGFGTLGGDVVVADGGAIAPGTGAGRLTINGKLSLSSGSTLNFEFGKSNVVGGAFNDLLEVGGDLVLDGTLNVATSAGGTFDPGIYRVIDYAGALTNNGLSLGIVPQGSGTTIQTSVAHQVNLVHTNGLALNFWDGAAALRNDGVISGGDGLWQNIAGNDNWTESDGAVNGQYADGAFAIFGGAPGVVTVDNSLGNVTASGMQFATDGYRIEGDSLTLVAPATTVRVGDGLAQGAKYTAMVAATLAGATSLDKTDLGTLVLAANNTYSGGTKISGGTLQLGDGGTTGSIIGDVIDNGTLAVDRSDATTISGVISGSGSFHQIGTGTTTLSASNSFAGGTTISAGVLAGTASSFGSGAITNNASLVIDQPSDASFANTLDGTGSFIKQGSGWLNYAGTGTLSGTTTITAGTFAVNGTLASSAMGVTTGATLAGTGKVGATTVASGGTIAPGNNSIGALHVNGSYTQEAGSTYQVEVDPLSTASDVISVDGAANIADGAGLNVTRTNSGDYRVGAQYTVLSAAGGVNGTYSLSGDTTSLSSFLHLVDTYDATHAYLTIEESRNLADAALTPNQSASANGIESLPSSNALKIAVLNSATDVDAQAAFDQLSGEIHASARTAALEDSRFVRDAAVDRVRESFCSVATISDDAQSKCAASDRFAAWGQPFGAWDRTDANGNTAAFNHNSGGFLIGIDGPVFNGWRVGMLGGFGHSSFDVKDRTSSGTSYDYHLGVYGGRQWGRLGLRTGASYSLHALVTDRAVSLPNFVDTLTGDYNARTTQVFGDLGEKLEAGRFSVEPFGNLAYVNFHSGDFSEKGGDAALTSEGSDAAVTFTTLGIRPSARLGLGAMSAALRGSVGWRHSFGDTTPLSMLSFSGGTPFGISGAPLVGNVAVIEAGFDFNVRRNTALGLFYGGQFGGDAVGQDVRGNVTLKF